MSNGGLVLEHYCRRDVAKEIAEYCRDRWAALEGSADNEARIFIRYHKGKPLVIKEPGDVEKYIKSYWWVKPRTIYCTVNVYGRIESEEDLEDPSNIKASTPFWDIDLIEGDWRSVIAVARELCSILDSLGLNKSVYILWSGEGAHVRVCEHAFSSEVLAKHNPLDIAFSVSEYILRRFKGRIESAIASSGGKVRVENIIDAKRVFTSPLSLHRRLDRVAVCLKPDDLDSFDISWTKPGEFRHRFGVWREYAEGEGDELAIKAVAEVKPLVSKRAYVGAPRTRRVAKKVLVESKAGGGIGRFQVMGLLQAARYYLLTGDLSKAKSFGLNRAIFYAWAKHYGAGYIPRRAYKTAQPSGGEEARTSITKVEPLKDEAPISPRGYFVMGGQEQLPSDYDKSIADKINKVIPYELAWEAALKYVSKFPRHVLVDPQEFYERVYEPVRDYFIEKVVMREGEEEPSKEHAPKTMSERRVVKEESIRRRDKSILDWLSKGN